MNFLDQNGLAHYTAKINSKIAANSVSISPSVKELFDLPSTATLDDILQKVAEIDQVNSGKTAVYITVKTTSGTPVPDCAIQKCTTITGQPVFTGPDGTAIGYMESSKLSKGLSIWNHIDFEDLDFGLVVKNGVYTAEAIVATRNFLSITSSGWWYASGLIKRLDVSVGGGGGGGAGAYRTSGSYGSNANYGGGGGGGGYAAIKENVPFSTRQELECSIGAKGIGGTAGAKNSTSGGTTSFLGVSAVGGYYGHNGMGNGNGNGGAGGSYNPDTGAVSSGQNGGSGTQSIFSSFSATHTYGGGGGGGTVLNGSMGSGGSPSGGTGGHMSDGHDGGSYGGGGGGGVRRSTACTDIYWI